MSADRKTIFLVDDNRSNLVMGKTALSGIYNVFTVNSGARMFQALEKTTPDLILLDVEMPEMDGYDVLERLKSDENTAHIPVIFLTAMNSEETEFKGLSLGAVDYITKPFSPPLLLKRIELHLQLVEYNNNLMRMVKEKTQEVVSLKNAVLKTTAELVEHRDATTGNHIDRTQRYIKILIGAIKEYGVYEKEISALDVELVLQSSALHDVGKISIKDSILLKPGPLTPEEFEEMKEHTTFGERIILDIKDSTTDSDFLEYARILAVTHHEKWDGNGYPHGLKGEDIPLLGRIMAIADVYDALVTDRPYKKAFPHSKAVMIIEDGKGTHFDPTLVNLFLVVHDEFEKVLLQIGSE
ncbi:MAG: response regulator [Oscillospiraceae bacterium]|nr:response regulator [Oscillospiraceae bacterium]